MRVLLPPRTKLEGFEEELQQTLEQSNLKGSALMGFEFREVSCAKQHEIDALVILEPGIFICLEAKCYKGKWTGSVNSEWLCDNQKINAIGTNPYKQVLNYSYVIKDKLREILKSQERDVFVNQFVVAPDKASFEIKDAFIDQFSPGKCIQLCHISKIENILSRIRANISVRPIFKEIGIDRIVSELIEIPENEFLNLDTRNELTNSSLLVEQTSNHILIRTSPKLTPEISGQISDKVSQQAHSETQIDKNGTEVNVDILRLSDSQDHPNHTIGDVHIKADEKRDLVSPLLANKNLENIFNTLAIVFGGFAFACVCYAGKKYHDFIQYPRLKSKEVMIGVIYKPELYKEFKDYLEKSVIYDNFVDYLLKKSNKVKISVTGNQDLSYQEAKNIIRNKAWDIAFTRSPALSVVAKESGYAFLGPMFPDKPPFYRAALYVRNNSSIKSLNDINSKTVVALGDFNSTSSFYVPVYDLYGKTISANIGGKGIPERVKSGQADIGAGVASNFENDPELRIIHTSRDIPGAGVYVSPKFSENEQSTIRQILMQAPAKIKKLANYGEGNEPNYTEFNKIRKRVDEVLSCSNFAKNPVSLFCTNQPEIIGRVNGGSVEDESSNILTVSGSDGQIYKVIVSHFIVPNPNIVQGKIIHLVSVQPRMVDGSIYKIIITNPSQISFSDN